MTGPSFPAWWFKAYLSSVTLSQVLGPDSTILLLKPFVPFFSFFYSAQHKERESQDRSRKQICLFAASL